MTYHTWYPALFSETVYIIYLLYIHYNSNVRNVKWNARSWENWNFLFVNLTLSLVFISSSLLIQKIRFNLWNWNHHNQFNVKWRWNGRNFSSVQENWKISFNHGLLCKLTLRPTLINPPKNAPLQRHYAMLAHTWRAPPQIYFAGWAKRNEENAAVLSLSHSEMKCLR